MKRTPSPKLSSVIEHKLRTTVPGRQTSALFASLASESTEPAKIEVWAPLIAFDWTGTERKIGSDTKIVEGSRYTHYDTPAITQFLSEEERDECRTTRHWLWFSRSAHSTISPGARANAFLLALWVARPTPTYIRVRFHHNDFGDHGATRVLDRFTWIGGQVFESGSDDDLDVVARLLPRVRACYQATARLRNALVLTVRGCTTRDWQVAFMCFTAAMTSLLRHTGRRPLIERLARGYGQLVSRSSPKGLPDTREFVRLHGIGTQSFLGRGNELSDGEENLRNLKLMADVSRAIWSKILESSRLRNALETSDMERARLFKSLRAG
jgi:hypothetical protein